MQKAVRILALLLLFILTGCGESVNLFSLQELSKNADFSVLPDQVKYPEADGVILLSNDSIVVKFAGYRLMTTNYTFRSTRLFKNIEKYASEEIQISETQKLLKIEAAVTYPDGIEVKLKPEEFFTITGEGNSGELYSSIKKIRFTYPNISKGCIVSYYTVVEEMQPFITDIWRIEEFLPIYRNRYSLTIPKILILPEKEGGLNWDWKYKVYNYYLEKMEVDNHDIDNRMKSELEKIVTFSWDIRNIAAFEKERMAPSFFETAAWIRFAPSYWKSWDDVAGWYFKNYFKPQTKQQDTVRVLAKKLTEGLTTDTDKIRALYKYVQNIRYVAVQLGDGGLRPHTPADVIEKQYGDCKDKALLLISLMRETGIDASLVLVCTKSLGKVDPSFPSWGFNHMITKCNSNGAVYWLDGTSKYGDITDIPEECEGVNVLVIDSLGKAQINTIPVSTAAENRIELMVQMNLSQPDSPSVKVTIDFSGEENVYRRYWYAEKTDKEIKEMCSSIIGSSFTNIVINNYSLSSQDSGKIYRLEFSFAANNILKKQSDLYFLNTNPFNLVGSYSFLDKDVRIHPIVFDYPYTLKTSGTVLLPKGVKLRTLPGNVQINSEFIQCNRVYTPVNENELQFSEYFVLKRRQIDASAFKEFKRIYRLIESKVTEQIVLTGN